MKVLEKTLDFSEEFANYHQPLSPLGKRVFITLNIQKKRRPIWSSLDVIFSSPTTANKEQLFLAYFAFKLRNLLPQLQQSFLR